MSIVLGVAGANYKDTAVCIMNHLRITYSIVFALDHETWNSVW